MQLFFKSQQKVLWKFCPHLELLTHPKVLLRPQPRLVVAVLPGHEQVLQAAFKTFSVSWCPVIWKGSETHSAKSSKFVAL